MKQILKFTAILLCGLVINFSCKKAETGPKGDTGAAGAPGTSGNANIQVQTFTTSTSSWISYSWPYEYIETTFTVSAITSSVVSNGDVRVYVLDAAGTSWMGMPYSFFSYQYNYKYRLNQVTVDYTLYNGGTPVNPGVQQFKVVVIPPALIKKYPNLDWNNYKEVKNLVE